MLRAKFTEASRFQNSLLTQSFDTLVNKKNIFIGRGQELMQKQTQSQGVIDLSNFDNTLSRLHACFCFSPAWFIKNQEKLPNYLCLMGSKSQNLPLDICEQIWKFLKPKKTCILKDLKSRVGIFTKVQSQNIEADMVVQFVHLSYIHFHHFQQYSTLEELFSHLDSYRQGKYKYIVLGDIDKVKEQYQNCTIFIQKQQTLRIWRFSVGECHYLLLIQENLVLRIGRSSHCQIQIKDSAISRYQAYLKCQNKKWKIIDGNQLQSSKNGTWKKCRSIQIPISETQDKTIKSFIKIGTIKCEIELIKNFSWLNVQQILTGQLSKSFIKLGIEDQTINKDK